MTTLTESQTTFDDAGFEAFLSGRDEPTWLTDSRRKAWSRFNELDWPNKQQEEWMRTDIRLFKLNKFTMPATPLGEQPTSVLDAGVDLGGQTISLDGISQHSQLDSELAAKGVLFGNLSDLLREHSEQLQPYFSKTFNPDFDRFSALHSAFWSSGTVLFVPRGVVVDKPLHAFSGMSDGGKLLRSDSVIPYVGNKNRRDRMLGGRLPSLS